MTEPFYSDIDRLCDSPRDGDRCECDGHYETEDFAIDWRAEGFIKNSEPEWEQVEIFEVLLYYPDRQIGAAVPGLGTTTFIDGGEIYGSEQSARWMFAVAERLIWSKPELFVNWSTYDRGEPEW